MCFGGGKKKDTNTNRPSLRVRSQSDPEKTTQSDRSKQVVISSSSSAYGTTHTGGTMTNFDQVNPVPTPSAAPPEGNSVGAMEKTAQSKTEGRAKSHNRTSSIKLTDEDLPSLHAMFEQGNEEMVTKDGKTEASMSEWSAWGGAGPKKGIEKKGRPTRLKDILTPPISAKTTPTEAEAHAAAAAAKTPPTAAIRPIFRTQTTQGDEETRLDRTQRGSYIDNRFCNRNAFMEDENKKVTMIPDEKTGKLPEESKRMSVSLMVKEDRTPLPLPVPEPSTKKEITNKKSAIIGATKEF